MHIESPTIDPASVAFGFGRRICAGRHFAENSLFIIVSSVLATLNIVAPLDEEGNLVQLTSDVQVGMLS
jgi:cytochrome P450